MVKRYYASFAHEVTPHCKTDCQEFVLASDYDDLNDRYRALTATGDGWHECEGCDTPRDCKYHGCGVAREIRGWERTVGPTPPAPVIPTTAVEVPLSEGPKPYCKCVLNGQRWLPEECPIHRPTDGSGEGRAVTVLRWKTLDRPRSGGLWVNGPVEVVLASEYDKLRAELEWLRAWRMKDPESVDHAIAYALGDVDEEGNEINTPKPVDTPE